MNMTFKLGKVMVPVPALKDGIIVEGLEVSVSDYNLMEGLKVLKELPSIMFELRQVMEVDLDDAPSAEDLADEQDEKDFVEQMLKDMGAKKVNHPIFGEGMAVPKDNPLLKAFLKHEEAQNGGELPKDLKDILGGKVNVPHPLEMLLGGKKPEGNPLEALLKGQGGNGKSEHPLSGLLNQIKKDLEDKLNK
jgi:hypothetical protein